jgi:FixJ family two-component response regulator
MDTKVAELLEDLKKLLILDLVAKGVQSKNIAYALGVDNAVITRIAPTRKIKKGTTQP